VNFRNLRADEIDCRVSTCSEKGVSLLLYKDARADMIILDETVGAENWQRSHELINGNLFCNVSIRCDGEWITKQDVGTESYTEKEKGQASDSFKRACFNWGIGRELYTAPFIRVKAEDCAKHEPKDGKWKCGDNFVVDSIVIKDKRIVDISIKNLNTKQIVFSMTSGKQSKQEAPKQEAPKLKITTPREQLIARLAELDISVHAYAKAKELTANSTNDDYLRCLKELENA
jgi:hypothetical protein